MNRCLWFMPIINLAVTNNPNIVNEINQASILDAYQSDINSMQSRMGAASDNAKMLSEVYSRNGCSDLLGEL